MTISDLFISKSNEYTPKKTAQSDKKHSAIGILVNLLFHIF